MPSIEGLSADGLKETSACASRAGGFFLPRTTVPIQLAVLLSNGIM